MFEFIGLICFGIVAFCCFLLVLINFFELLKDSKK